MLVVIIVEHAVFIWCVSFCLTGETVMIHNVVSGDEFFFNQQQIGKGWGCRVVTRSREEGKEIGDVKECSFQLMMM